MPELCFTTCYLLNSLDQASSFLSKTRVVFLILFFLKALCFVSCFWVKGNSILEVLCACVYVCMYVHACVLPSVLGFRKASGHGGREACGPTWALPECHQHRGPGPLCFWRRLCAVDYPTYRLSGAEPARKLTALAEVCDLRQPVCLCEPWLPAEEMADKLAWDFLSVSPVALPPAVRGVGRDELVMQVGKARQGRPRGRAVTPALVLSPVLRHHRAHLLPRAGRGRAGLPVPGLGEGPVPRVLREQHQVLPGRH